MTQALPTLKFSTSAACCHVRTAGQDSTPIRRSIATGSTGTHWQHRRGWRTTIQRLATGDAVSRSITASSYRSDPAHRTSLGAGIAKVRARGFVWATRCLADGVDRRTRSSSAPFRGRRHTRPRAVALLNSVPHLSWPEGRPFHRDADAPFLTLLSMPTTLRPTVSLDLIVPLFDNEMIPFPDSLFAAFEHLVVDLTGGITRRADVEGIWRRPDGIMQRERSRSYVTTVDAAVAERVATDIDALIRMQFRQLASYITATPTTAAVF